MKSYIKSLIKNPMAKDLGHPKYKQQVIPDKKKPKPVRKDKHKGGRGEDT